MFFLNPLALIGLALLSLPVIIHLLARRRARVLDFPTLKFLRETPSFRLRPRRIRQPLLLALRVSALLLIVLALARPLVTLPAHSERTRLILLDASLSMRAPGRTRAAREEARSLINRLAVGERAAIIAFSSTAYVLAAATSDRERLLATVEAYEPQSGAADFGQGFAVAATLLERAPPSLVEIDLISDFQKSNLATLAAASSQLSARITTHAVGAPIERNAALSDEAIRKSESGLALSAAELISSTVGRSGARRSWMIDSSVAERPDISWRTEANGQMTGHVTTLTPDDFDKDDKRFFAFAPPREARALLIETDAETNLYLGAALEAAASRMSTAARPLLTRQRQLPSNAGELNSYALVALTLHGALGAGELRLLKEYAEGGGTVWLNLARDVDTAQLNALAATDDGRVLPFKSLTRLSGNPSFELIPADSAAPPLRSMTESAQRALRAVNVREGFAFDLRAGAHALMRWSNGEAAFVSARAGERGGLLHVLGTSTQSAASDLNRSPAFPSLVFSLLRAAEAAPEPLSYNLGEAVDLGLSPWADVSITGDAARLNKAHARDLSQRPLNVFSEAGIYRLETPQGVRFVALNVPGAESERALASAEEVQLLLKSAEPPASAGGKKWREAKEREGDAWRYFLAAAFLLLLAELFVRTRESGRHEAVEAINAQPQTTSNRE